MSISRGITGNAVVAGGVIKRITQQLCSAISSVGKTYVRRIAVEVWDQSKAVDNKLVPVIGAEPQTQGATSTFKATAKTVFGVIQHGLLFQVQSCYRSSDSC